MPMAARGHNSLEAPPEARSILPDPSMSVMDALKYSFPRMANVQHSAHMASQWYSTAPPTSDLAYIHSLTIPSASLVNNVARNLESAIKLGTKSLCDPDSPSNENMPLWVVDYWQQVAASISILADWRTSFEWLLAVENTTKRNIDFMRLQTLRGEALGLRHISWKGSISSYLIGSEVQIWKLTSLLSTRWVNGDSIDVMLEAVAEKATLDGYSDVLIGGTNLVTTIINHQKQVFKRRTPAMESISDRVAQKKLSRMFLVENINRSHWIAMEVDFIGRKIRTGDSLNSYQHPQCLENALLAWLSPLFGAFDMSDDLPHGDQKDLYLCGICAINTIENRLWPENVPLWTNEMKAILRLEKFIRAIDCHLAQSWCWEQQ
ncbi:hypothetical protein BS47DRAFT_1441599 [Hydnum rufescens UP504]|uniref:Ubiquitin-like protease family profile domain-containing protein n=1 Tax=Hydnum rufescens UP504 TaxID=1448309 RepID=A0A9P6AEN4_9AGAM|nr:hypothetical protein BS47DRAFT_1441599 [Hydnum rufescens UP504]